MAKKFVARAEALPFVAVVELGFPGDPQFPGVSDSGELVLDSGEVPIWRTSTFVHAITVSAEGKTKRLLDFETADVLVTSSRVAFLIKKFDKGRDYAPLTGGLVHKAASVASHASAASRRRGKVLVGSLMFTDVSRIDVNHVKALIGSGDRYLQFLPSDPALAGLEINMRKSPADLEERTRAAHSDVGLAGSL